LLYLRSKLTLVISYTGYKYKASFTSNANEEPVYKEAAVERGDLTIDFVADGSADLPSINLNFPISGQLKDVLVEPGQEVKKGEILARLDDTDYANQLEQTRQEYALRLISEKRNLDQLKYQLENIELEYLPMTQIAECYSKLELEQKRIDYENTKSSYEAQVKSYEIIQQQAETAIKTAQDNLNNTVLISPVDAKILSIEFNSGETVLEEEPFMVLLDEGNVEVVAPVSEVDLADVSIGQKVEAKFDAFEGQVFSGKVVYIDSLPETDNSGLVSYEVRIELEEGTDKIKSGMTCTLTFILKEKKNVLFVPNKAVSIVDGQQVVQVKDKNGNVRTRKKRVSLMVRM